MSIESKIPHDEEINIADLTVEQKEKPAVVFDAKRDITPAHWAKMKALLDKDRSEDQYGWMSGKLQEMKLLFPEKVGELGLDEDVWFGIKRHLDTDINSASRSNSVRWDVIAQWLCSLKILFPERYKSLHIDQDIWHGIIKRTQELRNLSLEMGFNSNFSKMVIDLSILDPKETRGFSVNETLHKSLLTEAKKKRDEKQWLEFMQICVALKIIWPQEYNELLNADTWKNLRAHIVKKGDFKLWTSMGDYECIKILAADKVEFTDKGIEFTIPKLVPTLESTPQPLPEIKKF
jgi:hypothetical protein